METHNGRNAEQLCPSSGDQWLQSNNEIQERMIGHFSWYVISQFFSPDKRHFTSISSPGCIIPQWTRNSTLCGPVFWGTRHTCTKYLSHWNSPWTYQILDKCHSHKQRWVSTAEWGWSTKKDDWQADFWAVHGSFRIWSHCKRKEVYDTSPDEVSTSLFPARWVGQVPETQSTPWAAQQKSILHPAILLHGRTQKAHWPGNEMRMPFWHTQERAELIQLPCDAHLMQAHQAGLITDFRVLNSCLLKLNLSIHLVQDAIQMLGAAECEVISVCILRDTYHSMLLNEYNKRFCGITPYYGSSSYIYQRLGMGLSISPAIWQHFINKIMEEIPDRRHHFAIMDDCLIHSSKNEHWYHLTNLFKLLIKHGLKMSPKKCHFFCKKLTCMGHTIIINGTTPCITMHKSQLEVIQKLNQPKTARDCKSFCGMLNFLRMYLKDL